MQTSHWHRRAAAVATGLAVLLTAALVRAQDEPRPGVVRISDASPSHDKGNVRRAGHDCGGGPIYSPAAPDQHFSGSTCEECEGDVCEQGRCGHLWHRLCRILRCGHGDDCDDGCGGGSCGHARCGHGKCGSCGGCLFGGHDDDCDDDDCDGHRCCLFGCRGDDCDDDGCDGDDCDGHRCCLFGRRGDDCDDGGCDRHRCCLFGGCGDCNGDGQCDHGDCNGDGRCDGNDCLARLRCRYGYFIPQGCCGEGCPLYGHYHMGYAVNPEHYDYRDSGVYAAPGYGVPMAVPLAPNVNHTYNYGWGIPSSRLTPVARRVREPGIIPMPQAVVMPYPPPRPPVAGAPAAAAPGYGYYPYGYRGAVPPGQAPNANGNGQAAQ